MDLKSARLRVTLDGQLVDYWSREAARLDALAAKARFGWQRRSLERKAERARVMAARSRSRDAARRGPVNGANMDLSKG